MVPSNKVTAATGAAAVTTLIIWGLTGLGVETSAEVQGAITTLLVLAAGWLVPERGNGAHVAD